MCTNGWCRPRWPWSDRCWTGSAGPTMRSGPTPGVGADGAGPPGGPRRVRRSRTAPLPRDRATGRSGSISSRFSRARAWTAPTPSPCGRPARRARWCATRSSGRLTRVRCGCCGRWRCAGCTTPCSRTCWIGPRRRSAPARPVRPGGRRGCGCCAGWTGRGRGRLRCRTRRCWPTALPRVDWADAYAVRVFRGAPTDPQVWADAIFRDPPRWVTALLGSARERGRVGGHRPWRALVVRHGARTADEVLLGTDERSSGLPGLGAARTGPGGAEHRRPAAQPARAGPTSRWSAGCIR